MSSGTALRQTVRNPGLEATYSQEAKYLDQTVRKFWKQYGGDFLELRADADLLFVLAYCDHDEQKTSFRHWCRYKVWNGLLSKVRDAARRGDQAKRIKDKGWLDNHADPVFDLPKFFAELSEDATLVVQMALQRSLEELTTPKKIEDAECQLVQELRAKGWNSKRLTKVFNEIKESL